MNHSTLLAVAFPPNRGLNGALVSLADLAKPAYSRPVLMGKREAAMLVMRRNLSCHQPGSGNRAQRRIRALRRARSLALFCSPRAD